jgi:C-terminal peptidase (prc)
MEENTKKKTEYKFLRGALAGALVVFLVMNNILPIVTRYFPTVTRYFSTEEADVIVGTKTNAKLQEIDSLIQNHFLYNEDIKEGVLTEGLYRGYIEALDDIYAAYYDVEESKALKQDIQGVYSGIGAVLSQDIETKIITIMHTYQDSPAEKAGLKGKDILYKVDGEDILGQSVEEVVAKIRGKEGEPVEITVYRGDDAEEVEVTAIRAQIEVETVIYEMKSDKIGYIRITEFRQTTVEQYQEALEELRQDGMQGLVVDLRNNPGGGLDVVEDILGIMLPKNSNILRVVDANGNESIRTSTDKGDFDEPLVVLVNRFSASASEIYAGAIQDYQIGKIVGETTFGKGVIQQVFPLNDGSTVKLTVAEYLTANGNQINEVGVEPDVEVKFEANKDDEDADNQLEEAMKILEKDMK